MWLFSTAFQIHGWRIPACRFLSLSGNQRNLHLLQQYLRYPLNICFPVCCMPDICSQRCLQKEEAAGIVRIWNSRFFSNFQPLASPWFCCWSLRATMLLCVTERDASSMTVMQLDACRDIFLEKRLTSGWHQYKRWDTIPWRHQRCYMNSNGKTCWTG